MAKVQDYGKDTDIDIDSVLYFKADHKYTDVVYWDAKSKAYRTATLQWSLKRILAAHPEFEQTHRNCVARASTILSEEEGRALLAAQAETAIKVPCSRRHATRLQELMNANSNTA